MSENATPGALGSNAGLGVSERERLSELLRGLKVPPSHLWAHCSPSAMFAIGSAIAEQAEEAVELRQEVRYLRHYGNKDCTAMADAARQRNEIDT